MCCVFARGNQALSIGPLSSRIQRVSRCLYSCCFWLLIPFHYDSFRDILVSFLLCSFRRYSVFFFVTRAKSLQSMGKFVAPQLGHSWLLALSFGIASNGDALTNRDLLPWKVIASVTCVGLGDVNILPAVYVSATGPKLSIKDTITISLETGIQNTILASPS